MNTIIICCYAELNPKTRESVEKHAPGAIFIDTSGSPYDYPKAIERYWKGKHTLITIEQDIEINADVIPSFESCARDWCVFNYAGPNPALPMYSSLGCTKYDASLRSKIPFRKIRRDYPDLDWYQLDLAIQKFTWDHSSPHQHGTVIHHHDYGEVPNYDMWMEKDKHGNISLYRIPECTEGTQMRHQLIHTMVSPDELARQAARNALPWHKRMFRGTEKARLPGLASGPSLWCQFTRNE